MTRIRVETPCAHGRHGPHPLGPGEGYCHDATERVLTEGEYLLVEKVGGEWPDWAWHAVHNGDSIFEPGAILDALADQGET